MSNVNVSILLHAFFWCKIHRTWCNKSSTNPMLATPSCNMIPRIQVPQDRREKTTSTLFWHAWCMPWQGIWSGESCTSASNESKSKMIYTAYTLEKLRNYIGDSKQIARIGRISTWRTVRSSGKDMAAPEYQTKKNTSKKRNRRNQTFVLCFRFWPSWPNSLAKIAKPKACANVSDGMYLRTWWLLFRDTSHKWFAELGIHHLLGTSFLESAWVARRRNALLAPARNEQLGISGINANIVSIRTTITSHKSMQPLQEPNTLF